MKTKVNKEHQELLNNLKVMTSPEGVVQMFNVKKNAAGELFVAMIRKALTRSSYKLRVRGGLSDRVSLRKQGTYVTDQSVPLEIADRYRVYIDTVDSVTNYWMDNYNELYRKARRDSDIIAQLKSDLSQAEHVIKGLTFNKQQEKKQVLSLREELRESQLNITSHKMHDGNITITIKIQK